MLFSQYFGTVLSDQHHIFDLGGQTIVLGIDSPAIILIDEEIRTSFIDHRFNGEHHARNKEHLASLRSDVADPRLLVEFQSDSVSANIFYYRVAVCFGVGVDGVSDIA